MKPHMVQVNHTKSPFIEEGLYNFQEFEHHARAAASLTPPDNDHQTCVDITVMFKNGNYMDLHIHLNSMGDWGIMDRLSTILGRGAADPQILEFIASIDRTLH